MAARLRRVQPYRSPGFARERGTLVVVGRRISAVDRARVEALVIPPAWTDVWISRAANGHIQAVGVDAAGRRQYIYHPAWRERRDNAKFQRALDLAEVLPRARATVTRDLRRTGMPLERVAAAAFRILDTVAVRVGNEQYATAHGSRGLSTLLQRHASVVGNVVRLSFPAKSGVRARVEVEDTDLARVLSELTGGSRTARLLIAESGHVLSATDVNDYVRARTGSDFTAKDFRTLRGTLVAAQYLATQPRPTTKRERRSVTRATAEAVGRTLGNTPTVAITRYVDPDVFVRFDAGEVIDSRMSPERALVTLLRDAGK